MDKVKMSEMPSSLALLVDPTRAMLAAQRLYAASGHGLCHSGWLGGTVARGQPSLPQNESDDDDDDYD